MPTFGSVMADVAIFGITLLTILMLCERWYQQQ